MKFRLFNGTKALTDWTKIDPGKVDAWRREIAEAEGITNPRLITIGILRGEDLAGMTVAELRELAASRGLEVPSSVRKAELVEALRS